MARDDASSPSAPRGETSARITTWRAGDPPLPDRTDWDRVRAMSDDAIELAALSDPESVPYLTEAERLAELAALHARIARQAAE